MTTTQKKNSNNTSVEMKSNTRDNIPQIAEAGAAEAVAIAMILDYAAGKYQQ